MKKKQAKALAEVLDKAERQINELVEEVERRMPPGYADRLRPQVSDIRRLRTPEEADHRTRSDFTLLFETCYHVLFDDDNILDNMHDETLNLLVMFYEEAMAEGRKAGRIIDPPLPPTLPPDAQRGLEIGYKATNGLYGIMIERILEGQ